MAIKVQNVLYQIYLGIGSLDFLVSGLKLVVISGDTRPPTPGGWVLVPFSHNLPNSNFFVMKFIYLSQRLLYTRMQNSKTTVKNAEDDFLFFIYLCHEKSF